jgi:hypothetical protein
MPAMLFGYGNASGKTILRPPRYCRDATAKGTTAMYAERHHIDHCSHCADWEAHELDKLRRSRARRLLGR